MGHGALSLYWAILSQKAVSRPDKAEETLHSEPEPHPLSCAFVTRRYGNTLRAFFSTESQAPGPRGWMLHGGGGVDWRGISLTFTGFSSPRNTFHAIVLGTGKQEQTEG